MTSSLEDNYKVAYDNQIGFGKKPAMILIDFVQAYFDPACPLYADVEPALQAAIRIREAARQAGIPVIYTRASYDKNGINGGRFFQKAKPLAWLIEGTPTAQWPAGFEPGEGELVISKQYPSAFFGTSLSSTLTALGIDTVILTGLTTSGCVRATCVDAVSCGFIPIIAGDACGDRHEAPHNANLFDMNAKYGDVLSSQAVIDHLRSKG